ncbi:MAG TPA: hypothetical protein VI750_10640 [Pyrinomonadaceae bacterium]|nr:hypothetical protein [Pyrinomonadaceae bacterium]
MIATTPWGHHVELINKVKDPPAYIYYLRVAAKLGGSRYGPSPLIPNQLPVPGYIADVILEELPFTVPGMKTRRSRRTRSRKDGMNKRLNFFIVFLTVSLVSSSLVLPAEEAPVVKINKEYDKRTVIRKSRIPGAGNGLFAVVKIKKGEVIGELGGQLIAENDSARGNHYIASIPICRAGIFQRSTENC